MLTVEQLNEWKNAQELMRLWKEKELELRKEICEHFFSADYPVAKSFTEVVGDMTVKATAKVTTVVDEDELETMWDLLDEDERACFKFKPTVQKSELKKLPADSIVWAAITEKPATPTLSVD